jgi:hypothetical protein
MLLLDFSRFGAFLKALGDTSRNLVEVSHPMFGKGTILVPGHGVMAEITMRMSGTIICSVQCDFMVLKVRMLRSDAHSYRSIGLHLFGHGLPHCDLIPIGVLMETRRDDGTSEHKIYTITAFFLTNFNKIGISWFIRYVVLHRGVLGLVSRAESLVSFGTLSVDFS